MVAACILLPAWWPKPVLSGGTISVPAVLTPALVLICSQRPWRVCPCARGDGCSWAITSMWPNGDIAHVDLWAELAFTLDAAIIELMQLYAHSLGSNLFVVEQNCMWQTPDRRVTRIWFKRVPDVLTYVAEFSQRDQSERQGYITYVLR